MKRKGKPHVNTNPVADQYSETNGKIIEIFDPTTGKGCLVSIHPTSGENPVLMIDVYRCDPGIMVRGDSSVREVLHSQTDPAAVKRAKGAAE